MAHASIRRGSSSVVKITGIAFEWNGSTTAFGAVVRKPPSRENVLLPTYRVAGAL
jgi:hypothetical protein